MPLPHAINPTPRYQPHAPAPQYGENANLDGMGFSPFGKVLGTGMDVVDQIFSGHGESPDQGRIQSEGNKYLKKTFPKLSYINSVTVKTTDWPRKSPPEKKEL